MGWGWRFVICMLSMLIPCYSLMGLGFSLYFAGAGSFMLWVSILVLVCMPLWAPPYLRKVDSWL